MKKNLIIIGIILSNFIISSVGFSETIDSDGDVGQYTSITLDNNNNIHISYYDVSNGDLKYAYYNGSIWNIQTIDSDGDVGQYTSITLDNNNSIHISYYDVSNGDLKYAYYNGSIWNIQTIDWMGDVGWYSSIVVDTNNYVHISYYDATNVALKYAHYSGSTWNIQIIEDSIGAANQDTSITLDNNNYPHIACFQGEYPHNIFYFKWNGSTWDKDQFDAGADLNAGFGGHWISMDLDSNDYPHIAYYEYNAYHDLKYAYYDGTDWNVQTIDTEDEMGYYPSLVLDSNDYPHISYYHFAFGYDLKYAYFDGLTWHKKIIDSDGDVGRYTSIALDNNDNIYISYYDGTKRDLKYCKLGKYYIKGKINDPEGMGIDGVKLTLSNDKFEIYTTTLDGRYEFSDLDFGDYTVTPSKLGWTFTPNNRNYFRLNANQNNQDFLGTKIETEEGEVKIIGGENGYVNLTKGEKARIVLNPQDSGVVKIKIYNLSGELVWEQETEVNKGLQKIINWGGDNEEGQLIASGIYFIQVKGAGFNIVKKVAILK